MQEVVFLKINAPYWKKAEVLLGTKAVVNPDEWSDLYIKLTDDLAYARTFYPQSSTASYINNLTTQLHQKIYKNHSEKKDRIRAFWLNELPLLFYTHRRALLIALIFFSFAVFVGAFSSAQDPAFVRSILGDRYLNMTLQNIKNDDPMAVYKQMNEADMFLGITVNNIRVAFIAFTGGILFALGTAYALLTNGIMLGAFEYFFYDQGLLLTSMRTIWIHGTLEISAIIIAGAAGFVMGSSLLFPGTFTRGAAFKRAARDGMKMVVGLVPIFVMAGFLEGFVTRYTHMPLLLNLFLIGGSLLFILFYVILYPASVYRRKQSHAVLSIEENIVNNSPKPLQ